MISFFLFYLVGIPVSVFLHELGHAMGVSLFTKEKSNVFLGLNNESNKKSFQIGRIHFHLSWAYFGFCTVNNRITFSKFQNIMFLVGGPIVSFLLYVAAYLAKTEVTHFEIKNFLNGIIYCNLFLFFCTIIPIKYPNWLKPYAGLPSDGYQIMMYLKGKTQ